MSQQSPALKRMLVIGPPTFRGMGYVTEPFKRFLPLGAYAPGKGDLAVFYRGVLQDPTKGRGAKAAAAEYLATCCPPGSLRGVLEDAGYPSPINAAKSFFSQNPGASQDDAFQYVNSNSDWAPSDVWAAVVAQSPSGTPQGTLSPAAQAASGSGGGGGFLDSIFGGVKSVGSSLFGSNANVGTVAAMGISAYRQFTGQGPAVPAPKPQVAKGPSALAVAAVLAVAAAAVGIAFAARSRRAPPRRSNFAGRRSAPRRRGLVLYR